MSNWWRWCVSNQEILRGLKETLKVIQGRGWTRKSGNLHYHPLKCGISAKSLTYTGRILWIKEIQQGKSWHSQEVKIEKNGVNIEDHRIQSDASQLLQTPTKKRGTKIIMKSPYQDRFSDNESESDRVCSIRLNHKVKSNINDLPIYDKLHNSIQDVRLYM